MEERGSKGRDTRKAKMGRSREITLILPAPMHASLLPAPNRRHWGLRGEASTAGAWDTGGPALMPGLHNAHSVPAETSTRGSPTEEVGDEPTRASEEGVPSTIDFVRALGEDMYSWSPRYIRSWRALGILAAWRTFPAPHGKDKRD